VAGMVMGDVAVPVAAGTGAAGVVGDPRHMAVAAAGVVDGPGHLAVAAAARRYARAPTYPGDARLRCWSKMKQAALGSLLTEDSAGDTTAEALRCGKPPSLPPPRRRDVGGAGPAVGKAAQP